MTERGVSGQAGLYYNRIDRRRRHTLSHNLGLQSFTKWYFFHWTWMSFCQNGLCKWTEHLRNVSSGLAENKVRAKQAPVDGRHPHCNALNDCQPCAMLHAKCMICICLYLHCPPHEHLSLLPQLRLRTGTAIDGNLTECRVIQKSFLFPVQLERTPYGNNCAYIVYKYLVCLLSDRKDVADVYFWRN
jgi:hypothetical protein